ncbi:MAG: PE PGRS family protein, partial [Parcubacteria group bacterium Gr01-1014_20]
TTNLATTNFTVTTLLATTVSSTGITFTNATGSGNLTVGGIVSSTQVRSPSSTFTTSTVTTLLATRASSTGLTFTNATGSGFFTMSNGSQIRLGTSTSATNAILTVGSSSLIFAVYPSATQGIVAINTSTVSGTLVVQGMAGANAGVSNAPEALTVVGGKGGVGTQSGRGGGIRLVGGGGNESDSVDGGLGGQLIFIGGPGGSQGDSGNADGGAGGALTLTGGVGGNASGGTGFTGGIGGAITITAGKGGDTPDGQDNGGAGGNITINPGAGGAGLEFGATGTLRLAINGGVITAGSASTQLTSSTGMILGAALILGNAATGATSSGSGLMVSGEGVALLQGCTNHQVLKWYDDIARWRCAGDSGTNVTSTYVTAVRAMPAGRAFLDLSVTITPSAASSSILVMLTAFMSSTSATNVTGSVGIHRGTSTDPRIALTGISNDDLNDRLSVAITVLDRPASVAATTYAVFATSSAATTFSFLDRQLTAMEVGVGADIAELYKTNDQLTPGTLVSVDPDLPEGVRKSQAAYDQRVVGIVSTRPAIVVGASDHTSESLSGSVAAVALSGRVPVLVTSENGVIRPGDLLTSSRIPGVAMKATKAGVIVGQALTSFDGEGIGMVVVYVKTGYFNGIIEESYGTSSSATLYNGRDRNARLLFEMTQNASVTDLESASDIVTDRVWAGLEVVTPRLIAREVYADEIRTASSSELSLILNEGGGLVVRKEILGSSSTEKLVSFDDAGNAIFKGSIEAASIKAGRIDGLEVVAERLSVLGDEVRGLIQDTQFPSSSVLFESVETLALKVSGDSIFDGLARFNGGLEINGDLAVLGGKVTAGVIEAQEIRSPGLDYLSSTLSTLGGSVEEMRNRVAILENGLNSSSSPASSTLALDIQEVLNRPDSLSVGGELMLKGGLKVDHIESLNEAILIQSDAVFFGRPYLNSDSGGFATVSKDERQVDVIFDKEYVAEPVVNVTITLADNEQATSSEEAIFGSDIDYLVTRKSTKGFRILLKRAAPVDINFSWTALAIKDAKTFTFRSEPAVVEPVLPPPNENASGTVSSTPEIPEPTPDQGASSSEPAPPSSTDVSEIPLVTDTPEGSGVPESPAPVEELPQGEPILPEETLPVEGSP